MERLRKRVDQLVSRRPEDDGELEDDNEPDGDDSGPKGTALFPPVDVDDKEPEGYRRHYSEPTILHTMSSLPVYEPIDRLARHGVFTTPTVPTIAFPRGSRLPTSPTTPNSLGLNLVYSHSDHLLDLIFVHGLAGASTTTWSWEHDPANFWPSWLANDTDLSQARVCTYGYSAGLTGPSTTLNILDFAKDLLFRIKTFSSPDEQHNRIAMGSRPIIFIAHSMGGLVVKKAYVIGRTNPQYEPIIASVRAMVFLATPHKGSEFAQTLNNILKATPSLPKSYVADLERHSGSLQDINEQFRNMCGSLHLVSFYETLKTKVVGGIKKKIVEKSSALLEYPGETSSSLYADHHGMAKFRDPLDANFINVTNVLKWLMKEIVGNQLLGRGGLGLPSAVHDRPPSRNSGSPSILPGEISQLDQLRTILGILDNHDEDLDLFTERISPGSCQWLLRRQSFQDWAAASPSVPPLLWITGVPGSGKSTLASFVIRLLRQRAYSGTCHHHFFLGGDRTKRSLSYFLRSIAFQSALCSDQFCKHLLDLHEGTGITFKQEKVAAIWERIFDGLLFRLPLPAPLLWVVDGLDEADSAIDLLKLLSKIRSATRVNVLIISRPTKELERDITDVLPMTVHEHIDMLDTFEDIQDYVRQAVDKILPGGGSKDTIVQDIMSKASGSFLWVNLALDRIRENWHTLDDIKNALNDLPAGMESLYERMADNVLQQPDKTKAMALRILTWVTCSFSPLDITELEVALKPEFEGFVSLGRTAEEICGQFVMVRKSKVTLIHHTARQFLLQKTWSFPAVIQEHESHTHASIVCMNYLSDAVTWRRVFASIQTSNLTTTARGVFDGHPFLYYALAFWTYHVSRASTDSDDFLRDILTFLEEHCLLWINGVALAKDLRLLIQAAQNLKTYIRRRANKSSRGSPTSLAMTRDGELRRWANDIIRVVGRFGNSIAENPTSVYKHVVPFCPKDSIIAQTFVSTGRQGFSVSGLTSNTWDDCLARLSLGEDRMASRVLCKDAFMLTLFPTGGIVVLWRAETFEQVRTLKHGEYVTGITASKTSNLVATAGFKSTKVWDIVKGAELQCLPMERHHHTKALAFSENDNEILLAYDDCMVQSVDLKTMEEKWRFVAKEPHSRDFSCARYMAFSADRSQIAVVFRGRPVLVWAVQTSGTAFTAPKRCVLAEDRLRSAATADAWNAPELAIWHPVTDHLLILYEDTKIVEWNIADDEQLVYDHTAARSMALSQDGNFILTSDVTGTLSIWVIPGYHLLYQMRYDELVTDLTFSPDGTRFYDLRGSFCNVWEPDALIRADNIDRDDMSSTYETLVSEPVISADDNSRVLVTSLACDSNGRFYCVGKEDGSVAMHDMTDGQRVRKLMSHSSSASVIHLVWSKSEKYLASADDSGRVVIKRLVPPAADKDRWAVFPVADIRLDGDAAVEHMLFNTRDDLLLISTSSYVCVLSMKGKKEVCRKSGSIIGGKWFNNPRETSHLVRVDGYTERQYSWKTLDSVAQSSDESLDGLTISQETRIIELGVQVSERWLVLDLLESDKPQFQHIARNKAIEILDLTRLYSPSGASRSAPKRQAVEGLTRHIRQLVGCFKDRIVFLDHQFWLCTWEMELVYTKHKRHFFLPKDWVSTIALSGIALNGQGTLLCPRNGEVAIIKSGFA